MDCRKKYRRLREVICGLLMAISVASCGSGKVTPFNAAKGGSVAKLELQVLQPNIYTIYLKIPLPEGDISERRRLNHVAGSATVGDPWDTALIPERTPVHISIASAGPGKSALVFERIISKGTLMAVNGEEIDIALARAPLSTGKYLIKVEALENVVALANVSTSIGVFVRH